MIKSRFITVAILLCLSTSVFVHTRVLAQPSNPARQQQELVKRINQGALRFYKAFLKQTVRTAASADYEMNDSLEDLLLAVDGLTDSRYRQHNLVVVMQIASDIEQELLEVNVSSNLIIEWSRLHADLDRLAKMNGLKWSEAVITDALIAALVSDLDIASQKVQSELSPFQVVLAPSSADLLVLLTNFRNSAQKLSSSSVDKLRNRIEAVRNYARAIAASLNDKVISSELQRDWRRITSRLEELLRLYNLDSIDTSSQNIADQN